MIKLILNDGDQESPGRDYMGILSMIGWRYGLYAGSNQDGPDSQHVGSTQLYFS